MRSLPIPEALGRPSISTRLHVQSLRFHSDFLPLRNLPPVGSRDRILMHGHVEVHGCRQRKDHADDIDKALGHEVGTPLDGCRSTANPAEGSRQDNRRSEQNRAKEL